MAFTDTPTDYFASWAEDATDITVPIASFTGLTAATADGATGDIRKILYSVLDTAWAKWTTLTEANRSAKMTLRKTSFTNTDGTITHTFTAEFITAASGQTVVDE